MSNKSVPPRKRQPGRFKVGDRVCLLYGWRGAVGEVVEDRGNLAVGGERMYAVRLKLDQWNEMTTECPDSELEPAPESAGARNDRPHVQPPLATGDEPRSNKPAPPRKRQPARFKVGERVRLLHGLRGAVGEVVEDRGPLGVGGERIYAVRIKMDQWNEMTTEIPDTSLEAAPD